MFSAAGLASAKDDAALAVKGKALVTVDGARLGQVYRVGSDGAAQLILDGKIVSVPASTLSSVEGRLVTSLRKNEVLALQ
jgi:phosphohistidine swiveling domain-containing protein